MQEKIRLFLKYFHSSVLVINYQAIEYVPKWNHLPDFGKMIKNAPANLSTRAQHENERELLRCCSITRKEAYSDSCQTSDQLTPIDVRKPAFECRGDHCEASC